MRTVERVNLYTVKTVPRGDVPILVRVSYTVCGIGIGAERVECELRADGVPLMQRPGQSRPEQQYPAHHSTGSCGYRCGPGPAKLSTACVGEQIEIGNTITIQINTGRAGYASHASSTTPRDDFTMKDNGGGCSGRENGYKKEKYRDP